MSKLKTKSSVKGRFRVTASGKVKRQPAFKRHCLTAKPRKMKRQARGTTLMSEPDMKIVRKWMPYA